MTTELLLTLEQSLSEVDITTECVPPSEVPSAIADIVTEPAVSVDVGERLREQFTTEDTDGRTVIASGTSCHEQLADLLEQSPRRLVELLTD